MLVHYFNPKNMTNNCQNGVETPLRLTSRRSWKSRGVDAGRAERIRDVMEENLSEDEAAQLEERL